MNYQETIAYIHQTPKFNRELGNHLLKKLLSHCENPEQKLKFIHIAGTNGKGSTAIMLSEILQSAGYKTGLFTSPYIERFNERMRVNGIPIPDETLAEIVSELRDIIECYDAPVSEFALDTAAAFCWFYQQNVDFVVLETGLGGRLDATNVISESMVSIITTIGLDHTQYLGTTYAEIAAEKCGIIKKNCPVVSYPVQEDEVWEVLRQYTDKNHAPLAIAEIPEPLKDGMLLQGKYYPLGLKGEFQMYNAATVLKAIDVLRKQGVKISDSAVNEGLKKAKNPARFERFGSQIILDGAHNPQAILSLCQALHACNRPIYFCTAMMEDKDYTACISILAQYAKGVVATEIEMPRCCSSEILAEGFKNHGMEEVRSVKSPQDALQEALSLAGKDGLVCVCGSLYLAGILRPYLHEYFQ
ncbi:MAG: folylpolyglutamate synthase/dihydrofolate synthase family protein [Clostridia bacterium]|nr:folylpolyglutamate synthase/dihydrofolate synthase family protein [Clostridia bacterium]